jgi:oligopeptide transport system permease protein
VCYYDYYIYLHGFEPLFPFGTNGAGADILVSLALGARFSLSLAVCISLINFALGAIYGAIEGYYGGTVDLTMERIRDILSGVPFIIVVTLFSLHLAGKVGTIPSLLFAFVTTGWIGLASTTRSQFYRFKNQEYVLAVRTLGARDRRIIWKHIFPNTLGTLITKAVLLIPSVIFSESILSYLGIVNFESAGYTSIGTLLSGGQQYISTFPHIVLFPALFLSLIMISFNLLGNGLRDAFNPTT